jgi:hypothetical protein
MEINKEVRNERRGENTKDQSQQIKDNEGGER